MAEEKKIATGYIGNALRSAADNHTTTFSDEIFDTERQKYQNEVNTDLETTDNEIKADLEAETARAKAAEEANATAIAEEKAAIMGTDRIADSAVTAEKINFQQVTYPAEGLVYDINYKNKWNVYLTATSTGISTAKGMLVLRGIVKDTCIVKSMFFQSESYRSIIVLDANFEVLGAYNTTSDEFTSYYQDDTLTINWDHIISLHADAIFIALCLSAKIVNISSEGGNQWATSISLYDRKIAHISTELIKDSAVTTEKLAEGAVTAEKIADDAVTADNIKLQQNCLNFNASNLFNILDYEGFNANPSVWTINQGSATTPAISIEEQSNILGLKYSRCFTITDFLKDGKYYTMPFFELKLNALKGVKTKSFSFFVNIEYLYGIRKQIFTAFRGVSDSIADVIIEWGVDTHKESSKTVLDTISHLSVDIRYFESNGEKWAFVKGKFWVDDVSVVVDKIPTLLMGFQGGEKHVGEKTITCGWTIVAGEHDLSPFQYYPYNKTFFELFSESNIPDDSITSTKIQNKAITKEKLAGDILLSKTTLTGGVYASAGDSITEGAGITYNLDDSDEYRPLSGAAKPTYAYYIAKLNNMKWYNYGISGSTMGDIVANGSDKRGFSKMNGRYTQMADDLTHISIFFGTNDSVYGPLMKREDWLLEQYRTKIYYPRQTSLIGTVADDGTPYTTQEQYDSCNSVTGSVDGVQYNSSTEYFKALYCGNINSIDNKTWYGAWNIVLPYLIEKYPMAKILCIVPFGTTKEMREAVRLVAKKYGLPTYEFNSNHQLFYQWDEEIPSGKIGDLTVYKFRQNNLTLDGLHPTEAGYKYLYPSINARLTEL